VRFAAIILCVASQRVFIVVVYVYFVIELVRELLDVLVHLINLYESYDEWLQRSCFLEKLRVAQLSTNFLSWSSGLW